MPVAQQVDEIIKKVEKRLLQEKDNGIHLKVSGQTLDDDWLCVVVVPAVPGVRASEYARLLSQIERELRLDGDEHVLLVPALQD